VSPFTTLELETAAFQEVKSGSAPVTLFTRHTVALANRLTHNALSVKSKFFFIVIDFGEAFGFGRLMLFNKGFN
jgi:hypothetical protein